jgi:poly(glycerol-phosphate) alpha-glucosyltransferase
VARQLGLRLPGVAGSPSVNDGAPMPTAAAGCTPVLESLPEARYLFVVGTVPANFGGRSASILTKCRLLKEVCGVSSTIVTLNYSPEIEDVPADLRRRGLLVDGVTIVNLHDYFERDAGPPPDIVRHQTDEAGMEKIRDRDQEAYQYYANGAKRLYKRFDDQGRLLVRDWFDENQVRTRRDEFGPNGLIRRTIHLDPHRRLPQEEIFYRSDGTRCLTKRLTVDPATRRTRVEQVTLIDPEGRPVKVLESNAALKQLYLDTLIGDDRTFLSVESRRSDQETLTYRRPNVKQVYVLHNPHLALPGDDPSAIRPAYQPLFDHSDEVDAIVFLTNAQRADAEATFGRRRSFRVIPHSIGSARPVPFEDRDPNLVVMLARLDQQKQISDAITAFCEVVQHLPAARLQIYGDGPERARLRRQIDQLELGGSVTLMGYTKDPDLVYEQAALAMLTSRFEGLGLVLLESLSHGCPVISYDVRYGPSDIITDGVNGYLVEPGNTHALATRVVEVLRDEPLRRQLSERAVLASTEFSRETFVARWAALFRDLDAEGWG